MITVALYNLKGGVGKTASCVNLSYLAAQDGFKTLLWDIDPQGATTFYYNVLPKPSHAIKKLIDKDVDLSSAIMATEYDNLEIIPSDLSSKSLDVMADAMKGTKTRLKTILKQLDDEYDFVFIDCPPGLNALSENIFNAADIVLMPIIPTTLSLRTYEMVIDHFNQKDIPMDKLMCFFTMADMRKNMHHEIMEKLMKDNKFFQNYIPYLSDIEKMGLHNKPVHEFARNSYAAKCYKELWTEIREGVVA